MKKKLIINGYNNNNEKKIIHNYINHNVIRNQQIQAKLNNMRNQVYNNFVNIGNNGYDYEMYQNKPYTKMQIIHSLNILQETKITIENIYQEKYNNVNATGFGDFLRGSYFLMQFCEQYQLSYNINMQNHPISQFLVIYKGTHMFPYSNISVFDETNFHPALLNNNVIINKNDDKINNDFIYFLGNQTIYNNKIYTYTISYPKNKTIEEKHKTYMQQLLKPNTHLHKIIKQTLNILDLIEKEFIIIHIRYGDNFLIKREHNVNTEHLNQIYQTIEKFDSNQKILLISDNDNIKNIITTEYPRVKTHFNKITHTGEGVTLETDALQNTMIDLYLFSLARSIVAFSIYEHGTGFSKWIAETYSVPYFCRFLG